jgi:hypothetical protein
MDVLVKSGPPAVILGFCLYILWKAYTRKDDAYTALMQEQIKATSAVSAALEALTRKLDGARRRINRRRR